MGLPATARIGLRRAGDSIATADQLQFQLAHARARDAVHELADFRRLSTSFHERGLAVALLESAVPSGPAARTTYLRRPDLGRALSATSAEQLQVLAGELPQPPEIVLVVADGLSGHAIDRHALPLGDALLQAGMVGPAPVCLVRNGRVAVGDEIGAIFRAQMTILLIGERPGLSSPDSLGVYLTSEPRPGRTDAERNCISNVRPEGLSYEETAQRIAWFVGAVRQGSRTGYALKESSSPKLPRVG